MANLLALFTFFLILISSHKAQAFDVGGLVGDGNGGYSDTGFGGITGSGDLGISDGDLGNGFGAPSGDTGGNGSNGQGSEGFGGDGGGISGDTSSVDVSDQGAYHEGISIANSAIAIAVETSDLSESVKGMVMDTIKDDANITGMVHSIGKMNSLGMLDSSMVDGLTSEVDGIIGIFSQFNGQVSGKIDLASLEVHTNSEKIVSGLKSALKNSGLLGPIAKLGLKGTKIKVIERLEGSFYVKEFDLILLAKRDVDKYGIAVLNHELLHAGLDKSRKVGASSRSQYSKLSRLNKSQFNDLNGYVGNVRGLYGKKRLGVQEAFVIGWSYVKLSSRITTLKNSKNSYIRRATNYHADILNNAYLGKLSNGLSLRMIDSSKMSPAEVKGKFLNDFIYNGRHVRRTINNVKSKIKALLPSLCNPGTIRVVERLSCSHNEYIYSRQEELVTRTCGANMKWGATQSTGCGAVTGYKGP